MADPSSLISFLWDLLKYGGLIICALGIITFILARKNSNDDLATNAGWIVLGGIAAFAIGTFMSGQSLPTL